jgi:hypothetical protein
MPSSPTAEPPNGSPATSKPRNNVTEGVFRNGTLDQKERILLIARTCGGAYKCSANPKTHLVAGIARLPY